MRRAERSVPSILLARDIDNVRTKEGIRRAVVDVLRDLGMLPKGSKRKPRLELIQSNEDPTEAP